MSEWESISTPQSAAFIGWGTREGQHVTGKVVHIGVGSKPNNGGPCPELAIELTEQAHSYAKRKDEWSTFEPGQTVTVTCAQYQLERDIQSAQLNPGDLVKIEMKGVNQTRNGNTVKDFDVKVKRAEGAAAVASAPAPADSAAPSFTATAPF